MPANWSECLPYPFLALIAGLAFFVMGSNYWGRCYVIGGAFWLLAVLMPLQLSFAPLGFGILWFVALLTLGRRLREIGHAVAADAAERASQIETVLFKGQGLKK